MARRKNFVPPPEPGPDASLAEAIEYAILIGENGGGKCPCCRRRVQVYPRTFNSSMAYGLITLYRKYGHEWGHVPTTDNLAQLGGEVARLALWNLIEESEIPRADGGRDGWWRVTSAGADFARNRTQVPKVAYVYSGEVLRFSEETISVVDALRKKFNYAELMSSSLPSFESNSLPGNG